MPYERDVDINVLSRTVNVQVGEDLLRRPVATRDGALFSADWYYKQLLRGKIFQVAGGLTNQVASTPAVWGALTLDTDEFDLLINVPKGTTIVPLQYTVIMEKFGTTQLFEILLATGTGAVSGGSGVTLTPVNQNGASNKTSALANGNVLVNNDDGGTALTQESEIWRDGLQLVEDIAADDNAEWPSRFEWTAENPGDLHVVEGQKFIAGWIAAQAGQGFQKFTYAEFETGEDIG